jgi:2-(1,2-epoxy-1,2-dihydrophenyl)acetyl-CoA isomerase
MSDINTTEAIVTSTIENGIKTISLNIPKKKNPLKPETMVLMLEAIKASSSDGTKVIVLTGAGGNFSSGAMLDASMMQDFSVTDYLREKVNPVVLAIRESSIPFIAKVEGFCVGLGFSLAMACDMLICSENAKFNQIFTRIGLSSDGGGSYFLARTVGYRKAFELIANNQDVSAQEALDWGIANHVFPSDQIAEKVNEMATRLANGPLVALAQVKSNVRVGENGTLAEALDNEAINQGKCFKSSDFMEGINAFMQKRPAEFKGK